MGYYILDFVIYQFSVAVDLVPNPLFYQFWLGWLLQLELMVLGHGVEHLLLPLQLQVPDLGMSPYYTNKYLEVPVYIMKMVTKYMHEIPLEDLVHP